MIGIYKIVNTANGKVYIGQSTDIRSRFSHHRSELRGNRHHNPHLQAAWNKYGPNAFKFEILEECDKSKLNERETFWKVFHDPNTYNLGHTNSSGSTSIEVRNKLRERILGENNPAKRPEVRQKISERRKGCTISEEARKLISDKLRGRTVVMSPEHILHLRQASPNKKKVEQLSTSGLSIKVWDSVNDAARALNVSQANISDTAAGKQKTCKGFLWRYLE